MPNDESKTAEREAFLAKHGLLHCSAVGGEAEAVWYTRHDIAIQAWQASADAALTRAAEAVCQAIDNEDGGYVDVILALKGSC